MRPAPSSKLTRMSVDVPWPGASRASTSWSRPRSSATGPQHRAFCVNPWTSTSGDDTAGRVVARRLAAMSATLTPEARALLAGPRPAPPAPIRPDGTPASHPVWVGLDGDRLLVSTGRSRPKTRNVEHDPHVALS